MARYVVEDIKISKYQMNYGIPFANIIPAIVWSIPVNQWLFPEESSIWTLGCSVVFIAIYVALSFMPVVATIPCIAGVFMDTALIWVFADYIEADILRIAVKIVILAFFLLLEVAIWINATLPWLEKKEKIVPRVYKIDD